METMPLVAMFVLVSSGFVATNLDNLLLLVVLQASSRQPLLVLAGFLASSAAILLVASGGLLLGSMLDPSLVGFVGVVPLGLGCHALWQRRLADLDRVPEQLDDAGQGAASIFINSTLLMLSNSGDSLAIFLPLLADTSVHLLPAVVVTWLLAALLWAWLAHRISGNRSLAATLERLGARWLPWMMIVIGSYILLDTITDSL